MRPTKPWRSWTRSRRRSGRWRGRTSASTGRTCVGPAAAVEEATGVRVLFRDVLAAECDAVPVLLSAGRVVHEADREALRPWLAAGGRLFCNVCFQHDFGESRPGVLPDEDEKKESVDILVATCKEILAASERLVRLPHDPCELLDAAREGDDVLVTFRDVPASTTVRDLEDVLVADVVTGPDGQLRFRAPDGPRDPFFHRLVATWKGEGWTLRRAWRIVDLVGTAERFVFAPKIVEAGATFAPRVLFLNSLTGAPVPGREARLALLVDGEVVTEAVGRSGPTGSVDAVLGCRPSSSRARPSCRWGRTASRCRCSARFAWRS